MGQGPYYHKSSIKPPGWVRVHITIKALLSPQGANLLFAALDGGLKEKVFIREWDIIIIQGKKYYKNVLIHFLLWENCANSFKSLLMVVNYNLEYGSCI